MAEKRDDSFGCYGLAIGAICLYLAIWTWPRYDLAPFLITECLALILFIGGWVAGHAAAHRGRVLCLVVVFVGLVLQFAVIHAWHARVDPTAFRVADPLLDARVREELDADRATILRDATRLFVATLLEANAPAMAALARNKSLKAVRLPLPGNVTLHRQWEHVHTEDFPRSAFIYRLTDAQGAEILELPNPHNHIGEGSVLAGRLQAAKSPGDVVAAARQYAASVQNSQARAVAHMKSIIRRESRLDMSHYIYFSATIMTTIGSSDLTPATSLSRYLVTLQAFVAVFYLGFAINFLWPSPHGAEE